MPSRGRPHLKVVYPEGVKELSEDLHKDELIRRLKVLAKTFADMDQDQEEDKQRYEPLSLHLASEHFLHHESKDVKLIVGCCIADIFRIYAPEAPYKDPIQLKEIFLFLVKQLRGLEDINGALFKRYFYLLENLSWVKSFNICFELEDCGEIFNQLFETLFSIVHRGHSNKVRTFMLDMMSPIITEGDSVSQDLLDIILMRIIEPQKSKLPEAYELARDLIKRTSQAIEPYIQTFFNNVLVLGKTSESDASGRIYDLIYELNLIAPNVLLSVLPQLEFKLRSNDGDERLNVTRLLARMFSDKESQLSSQNKPLWNCYLGRFKDVNVSVRVECVKFANKLLINHQNMMEEVTEQLKARCHDPDESVRYEVVSSIIKAAKESLRNVSQELLSLVQDRMLDKKFKIRREANQGLALIYREHCTTPGQEDEMISWIKNKLLHVYYQTSPEDRLLVEHAVTHCLVPYTMDTKERMRRLFRLYATLDEHAVKSLNEVFRSQHMLRNHMKQLLDLLEEDPAGEETEVEETKKMIASKTNLLARSLSEPSKAQEQVKKFVDILGKDERIHGFMQTLVDPKCTCEKAPDTMREIQKKIGHFGQKGPASPFYDTVKNLLEKVSPLIIDPSAVDQLFRLLNDTMEGLGDDDLGDSGQERGLQLILMLSPIYPESFQSQDIFGQLLSYLKKENTIVVDTALQIFSNTGAVIEESFPQIKSALLPVLQAKAKSGTPRQAKHAIRCVNTIFPGVRDSIFNQIFEHLRKKLSFNSTNFLTALTSMGHLSLLAPELFSQQMKNFVAKFIVKDLLMQDRVIALKLIVNWLLGMKSNENSSCTSTFRLLHAMIKNKGDLMNKGAVSLPERAHLRLAAGCAVLKLAQERVFAELLSLEQFQMVASLMNDSCLEVRQKFTNKLHKGLMRLRLPLEYMSIFSLAAREQHPGLRRQIKACINKNIAQRRQYRQQHSGAQTKLMSLLPDYVVPYTIHLLAHDPRFYDRQKVEQLKDIKECLWFIMEPLIMRSENQNYIFLKKLIEVIKSTKDAQCPERQDANEKMYAVCDLAHNLLVLKATNVTWKEHPVQPDLPSKLFTRPDFTQTLNTKSYLPSNFQWTPKKKTGVAALMDKDSPLSRAGPRVSSEGPGKRNGTTKQQKAAKEATEATKRTQRSSETADGQERTRGRRAQGNKNEATKKGTQRKRTAESTEEEESPAKRPRTAAKPAAKTRLRGEADRQEEEEEEEGSGSETEESGPSKKPRKAPANRSTAAERRKSNENVTPVATRSSPRKQPTTRTSPRKASQSGTSRSRGAAPPAPSGSRKGASPRKAPPKKEVAPVKKNVRNVRRAPPLAASNGDLQSDGESPENPSTPEVPSPATGKPGRVTEPLKKLSNENSSAEDSLNVKRGRPKRRR
ncbi:PDS5B [Branchiostoma lanceolatum]|uniref:PDS5B protein n=1 Tax=Branchiostoma lanceolatum TaxID=7740 RepID=A0A8K0A4G4_BRALA|nr:PDS5B [Branchiostoma lanceolatum]